MSDTVTLLLPSDVPTSTVEDIMQDIKAMNEVTDAGTSTTRSIELAAVMVWIGFAANAIGVVSGTTDLFKKISDRLKGKGVRGAQIELPNGVKISLESATVEEIKQIVSEWKREE